MNAERQSVLQETSGTPHFAMDWGHIWIDNNIVRSVRKKSSRVARLTGGERIRREQQGLLRDGNEIAFGVATRSPEEDGCLTIVFTSHQDSSFKISCPAYYNRPPSSF
ncbi:hypothetical protein K438DRAFT_1775957 [Mycena galopus ATCC 62051]|nr:hypothetical protein K438DRAFT_1775957 [Mycena galopus ATCC 62051]